MQGVKRKAEGMKVKCEGGSRVKYLKLEEKDTKIKKKLEEKEHE